MRATNMNILRRIEGVCRLDRLKNEEVRERLGQDDILDVVRRRQEKWKEKLEVMSDQRLTKAVFKGELEGRRPKRETTNEMD